MRIFAKMFAAVTAAVGLLFLGMPAATPALASEAYGVRGTVVDASDKPIAHAEVRVYYWNAVEAEAVSLASGETDDSGNYSMEVYAPGYYGQTSPMSLTLRVTGDLFETAFLGGGSALSASLSDSGAWVGYDAQSWVSIDKIALTSVPQSCGKVTGAGWVAGDELRSAVWAGPSGWMTYASATIDDGGNYCVEVPKSGTYTIDVWAVFERHPGRFLGNGWKDPTPDSDTATRTAPQASLPDIEVPRYTVVTGTVLGSDGSPLHSGYDLSLAAYEHGVTRGAGGLDGGEVSGSDSVPGAFALWLPAAGTYDVVAQTGLDRYTDAETTVEVPADGLTGVTLKLGPGAAASLQAGSVPAILGTVALGSTVSASAGSWNDGSITDPALTLSYQWLVNGELRGSGPSYAVQAQDAGKALVLRVFASRQGFTTGMADSVPVVVPLPAVVPVTPAPAVQDTRIVPKTTNATVPKLKAKKKATVKVSVVVPGKVAPTGQVTILEGGTKLGSAKLVAKAKGKVKVSIKGLKKGTHTLIISYSGNGTFKPFTRVIKVKVK